MCEEKGTWVHIQKTYTMNVFVKAVTDEDTALESAWTAMEGPDEGYLESNFYDTYCQPEFMLDEWHVKPGRYETDGYPAPEVTINEKGEEIE